VIPSTLADFIIGENISEAERYEFFNRINEEGGAPYIAVRRAPHERPSTTAYAYIEPSQTVDQIVTFLESYLRNL